MSLQNISIILNIVLSCTSIYLFIRNRKISRIEAEKNYNHASLEIDELWRKNEENYKKKAVELGAYLNQDGQFYERSFRGLSFLASKELETLHSNQENQLDKKRNELRYWGRVGNINMFTGKPITFRESVRNFYYSIKQNLGKLFKKQNN